MSNPKDLTMLTGDDFLQRVPASEGADPSKNEVLRHISTWLNSVNRSAQLAVAARAALRFLPSIAMLEDVHEQEQIALHTLRCMLIASVSARFETEALLVEAGEAGANYEVAMQPLRASSGRSHSAGRTGVIVGFAACRAAALLESREYALRAIFYEPRSPDSDGYHAAFRDMDLINEGMTPSELFRQPLWHGVTISQVDKNIDRLNDWFDSRGVAWAFWRRWYAGMLDGQPLALSLETAIAETETKHWIGDPMSIARRIALNERNVIFRRSLPTGSGW
jgi:hypothetical protein